MTRCRHSDTTLLAAYYAMALLMCHTQYTLTQRKTPGLINNTLPSNNLKTGVMDVYSHCNIQWETSEAFVFDVDPALQLTDNTDRRLPSCISSEALYALGCGRRYTLVQCCPNAGPPFATVCDPLQPFVIFW